MVTVLTAENYIAQLSALRILRQHAASFCSELVAAFFRELNGTF